MSYSKYKYDILFLLGSILLLLSASVITVKNQEHLNLFFLNEFSLPSFCLLKNLFGIDCPTCGMSRGFIEWLHGNFHEAWEFHRLSILAVLFCFFQIPYRVYVLITGKRIKMFSNTDFILGVSYTGFFLLIVNWIYNLWTGHVTP